MYFDCLKLSSRWSVARCLLQLNSLEKTMECTNWSDDRTLWFDLSENPKAKEIDLVPSLHNYDPITDTFMDPEWYKTNDGLLQFTPRGLIVAAAEECVKADYCLDTFYAQVLSCPEEDMEQFIPCLYCYGVEEEDINGFEKFIRSYKFGKASYDLSDVLMEWKSKVDCTVKGDSGPDPEDVSCFIVLRCGGIYVNLRQDGDDDNLKARSDEDSTDSYDLVYTMSTKYPTSAPTPKITLSTEDDDGIEDAFESVSSDVLASTTTINRKEAAPTTRSPENGTGRHVVNVGLLGVLYMAITLL